MQEDCRLRPAKPPAKIKEVCKGPQKRSKVASLSTKKNIDIKEVFIDNSRTKDLGKE